MGKIDFRNKICHIPGGGTKIIVAVAPVAALASLTELNTGRPKWFLPPFPGETPPTKLVPYSMDCLL